MPRTSAQLLKTELDMRLAKRGTGFVATVIVTAVLIAAAPNVSARQWPRASASAHERSSHGVEAGSLPFGPWHLPNEMFHQPFTGTVLALHPNDALPRLEAARRAHMRVFIILDRSRRFHQNPDKSFNLQLWQQEIARFEGIDFAPFVTDGTLLGHMMIDEPHDPTNWNGKPMPYATVDSAAAFSKNLWPTVPAGVNGPPTWLEGAGPGAWKYLDWGFAQWRPKKGDPRAYVAREVEAAKRLGLGLVLSINTLGGSALNGPITAEDLLRGGSVLAGDSYGCALLMWKYDVKEPSYYQRPDVLDAVRAISETAASHPPGSCRRR